MLGSCWTSLLQSRTENKHGSPAWPSALVSKEALLVSKQNKHGSPTLPCAQALHTHMRARDTAFATHFCLSLTIECVPYYRMCSHCARVTEWSDAAPQTHGGMLWSLRRSIRRTMPHSTKEVKGKWYISMLREQLPDVCIEV